MPQQVGIRELKNEASEIIRAVREERAEYVVTYRGQPAASCSSQMRRLGSSTIVSIVRIPFQTGLSASAARSGHQSYDLIE